MTLQGQVIPSISGVINALALSDRINTVRGVTPTLITNSAQYNSALTSILVLHAEAGGWRVRLGDHTTSGMPDNEMPLASISDGSGSLYIPAGETKVLSAPRYITVKGFSQDSCLTYYFL